MVVTTKCNNVEIFPSCWLKGSTIVIADAHTLIYEDVYEQQRGREHFNLVWNQCQLCWGGLRTFSHSWFCSCASAMRTYHPRLHGKMCTVQDISFYAHLYLSVSLSWLRPPFALFLPSIHLFSSSRAFLHSHRFHTFAFNIPSFLRFTSFFPLPDHYHYRRHHHLRRRRHHHHQQYHRTAHL